MAEFSDLLYLLLGWALGLLSPVIVARIQRQHSAAELQTALRVELRELQFTLMATAFRVRSHLGTLDKRFLDWAAPVYRSYKGSSEDAAHVDGFGRLLTYPPEQLAAVVESSRGRPGTALNLKTHALPFLAAQVGSLSICPSFFHQAVLQVKARVDQFNEHIDYMRRQYDLTFQSISTENREVVTGNLRRGYEDMVRFAESLVALIGSIVDVRPA